MRFNFQPACFLLMTVCAPVAMADVVLAAANAKLAETAESTTAPGESDFNWHAQSTFVSQYHPSYRSPYTGANSLSGRTNSEETTDVTLFAGARLWQGAAFYFNEELDQGFGLNNTMGMAGFPSGEAYKVGESRRYFRTPRAFIRQVFNLGGAQESVVDDINQLAGTQTHDNITLTVGKFSAVDIFDNNRYAHDPRADFLNWSVFEAGAFDYAADSWGYTNGIVVEWTQDWWTLRGGVLDLSNVPNSPELDSAYRQLAYIAEGEERHEIAGHPGKLKLLGFVNHGKFGTYRDAVALAAPTGDQPDTALVRHYRNRPGIAMNLEQEVTAHLGVFARASVNDGHIESDDFTDINQSVSTGVSLNGDLWARPDDTLGAAVAINSIANDAKGYFKAGGMGILIGDGAMNYAPEKILETYYSFRPVNHLHLTADFQHVNNPAYNQDRGPIRIYALRVHLDI